MKDEKYQFIRGQNGKVSIAGLGSYGEVKLARNTQTKQMVAIKMIHKNAKQQIDVHHKLNHHNIIHLLNYNYDKDKNVTYMVLEYAENGTLSDKIKYGLGQLPKNLIRQYFKDVCEAIQYVHANKYMHRDIKPQNILLTKDNHAKLCDFGFAAILEYRSTLCGTYQYMSPQMIQKKAYDYKIDIWALGILLFEMIQGTAPFRGDTGQQVISEMKKPIAFSNRFEPQQIDLIKKILRVNSDNRPTVQQILQHPYFKLGQPSVSHDQLTVGVSQDDELFRKRNSNLNSNLMKDLDKKSEYGSKSNVDEQQKQFRPFVPSKIGNDPKSLLKNYNNPSSQVGVFSGSNSNVGSVNSSVHVPSSQNSFSNGSNNSSMRVTSHQQPLVPNYSQNISQNYSGKPMYMPQTQLPNPTQIPMKNPNVGIGMAPVSGYLNNVPARKRN